MDDFYEYFEILPEPEKYESVMEEMLRYKRDLIDPDLSSMKLSENVIEFIRTMLYECPYPTNNIIDHIINNNDQDKNLPIEEAIFDTLAKLIQQMIENPQHLDKKFKLLNMLSNTFMSERKSDKIKAVIIPALYDLKENRHLLNHELYLAMLSRTSFHLLNSYLEYERREIMKEFDTKSTFLSACYERKHWIDTVFKLEHDEALRNIINDALYENLVVCRMVINYSFPESVVNADLANINATVIENNYLKLFMMELSRQQTVLSFLSHSGKPPVFATSKKNIMTELINSNVSFDMENYDELLNLLQYNNDNNVMQMNMFDASIGHGSKSEIQLFNEYMIVKFFLTKIIGKDPECELNEATTNYISKLLNCIYDKNVLFKIMQTILCLIFLRFEHIKKARRSYRHDLQKKAFAETYRGDEIYSNSEMSAFYHNEGFFCSKSCLELILNSMQQFLTTLHLDESLKEKFTKMMEAIETGLWKYQVIEMNSKVPNDKSELELSKELIVTYEELSKSVAQEMNTSDRKLNRKKLRKRSRASYKSDISNEGDELHSYDEDDVLSANEPSLQSLKNQSFKLNGSNFMTKMLMKPESLVALCAKNNDYGNIETIIQDYNLTNTAVDHEINYITNYQAIVGQLRSLALKYNEVCEHEKSAHGVEEIKNCAEIGFEAARFMDVLEKYCYEDDLKHIDNNDVMLTNFLPDLPNLRIYSKQYIKLASIMDLMISVPTQCELTSMITKLIMKKWNFNENGNFFADFLRRIFEMLNIFQNYDKQFTLPTLLSGEVCSFEPSVCKSQIENRINLKSLLEMKVDEINAENLTDLEKKMENFQSDVNYFKRISTYVTNVKNMVEMMSNDSFDMNDVVKNLNIFDMIGQIVFISQQIQPELLETIARDSNINLVHTMAVTGGSEILPPFCKYRENEESIELERKESEFFDLSSTTILYYIKHSGAFLVAYLIKEIQCFNYQSLKYDEPNHFERMKDLESIQNVSQLFDGNDALAALNYDTVDVDFVCKRIDQVDETEKLNILTSIGEINEYRGKIRLDEVKDSCYERNIEQNLADIESMLMKIGNVDKFNELLLKHVKDIKSHEELEDFLSWSLSSRNRELVRDETRQQLQQWLNKIKVYRNILQLFRNSDNFNYQDMTWQEVSEMAEKKTSELINFLLNDSTDLDVCNQLLKIHPLQSNNEEIFQIFLEALNKEKFNEQHDILFEIILNFSTKSLIDFFDFSLDFIHNNKSMEFILDYLLRHDYTIRNNVRYQKFKMSCIIIRHLDDCDEQLWSLASYPLVLIEQLLMNLKIEVLIVIVQELRVLLESELPCKKCDTTQAYQICEEIVYDYDALHKGCRISNNCLDFLFKIYAAKALDFQIIDMPEQSNQSMSSRTQSPDRNQAHQIPTEVPSKDEWIPDNETTFCMCCKISKFSLLNRRHHCRRCGNVICGECSRKRILLPVRYRDLMVRCCDDCYIQLEITIENAPSGDRNIRALSDVPMEWKLTANIDTDQMIRDEFTFEYSPNVALCIAIVSFHTVNEEFTDFIMFHCHRLQLLLQPSDGFMSPEIDVVLVATMLRNLANTAKLFGKSAEANAFIEQIDIILKIAEDDCSMFDSIMSKASYNYVTNSLSIRDIVDELVKLEKWPLALDLCVKWDRNSSPGIFAAWAVSLIKRGDYVEGRKKANVALQSVVGNSKLMNDVFIAILSGDGHIEETKFSYQRHPKSSPLFSDIIDAIETTIPKCPVKPVVVAPDDKLMPVKPMEYYYKIANGDYTELNYKVSEKSPSYQVDFFKSPYYKESMYYLIKYGGNIDILEFFIRNKLVKLAVRYFLIQGMPIDMFIQYLFIPIVRMGKIVEFMKTLKQMDVNFIKSEHYIVALIKYLERKRSLRVLYQIQLLIEDNIRAALTSQKFYLQRSGNYTELHEKSRHLINAKAHLEIELERVENAANKSQKTIQLKWDIKKINAQINIILLQIEVSKHLANCEANGYSTFDLLPTMFLEKASLKTLFGKPDEQYQVAILLLICDDSVESSFGLCYRIIQECSLTSLKIYSTCTKYFAHDLERAAQVNKLINCMRTNALCGENEVDPKTQEMCDELICLAVEILYSRQAAKAKTPIDNLVKIIHDWRIKIECFIKSDQLKAAFLLYASMEEDDGVRRILKLAEMSKQDMVIKLCGKKLAGENYLDDSSSSTSTLQL